mgnify:CR=1 FL=1
MQVPDGSIKIYNQDGKAIIKLSGALNSTLSENLRAIIPKIQPPVILDFNQTPYITADGLQVLLEFYIVHRTPPTLTGVNALTQRLIKLTGMDRYLQFDHKPIDPLA